MRPGFYFFKNQQKGNNSKPAEWSQANLEFSCYQPHKESDKFGTAQYKKRGTVEWYSIQENKLVM